MELFHLAMQSYHYLQDYYPLDIQEVKYENLVTNLINETRNLIQF